MHIDIVIDILQKNIPKEATWHSCDSEYYGFINRNSLKTEYIKKILYCVTPTLKVVDYFKNNSYDLLFSHHPFQTSVPQFIAHTAFDCCDGGLNDFWKNKLEIKNATHFDGNLGWYGEIEPIKFTDLVNKITNITKQPLQSQNNHIDVVKNVIICTGLGGLVNSIVAQYDPDCYITGEGEMGDCFKSHIEIGHTLSEQVGIYRIRELLPDIQIDLAPLSIDYFNDFEYIKYNKKNA